MVAEVRIKQNLLLQFFGILLLILAPTLGWAQESTSPSAENTPQTKKETSDSLDNLSTEEFLSASPAADKALPFTNKAEKNRIGWASYLRMFIVLGFVLILIFIFFYLSKNKLRKSFSNLNGVEVLARTSLLPKQTLLLVRIGPRILALNASSDGHVRTLTEFTQPEEIDQLLSEISKNSRDSIFQSLLTRNQVLYDEEAQNTEKVLKDLEKQTDELEKQ